MDKLSKAKLELKVALKELEETQNKDVLHKFISEAYDDSEKMIAIMDVLIPDKEIVERKIRITNYFEKK